MQLWQYCLLVTAKLLYMFQTLSASIIMSTKNCRSSHWCKPLQWQPTLDILTGYISSRPMACTSGCFYSF